MFRMRMRHGRNEIPIGRYIRYTPSVLYVLSVTLLWLNTGTLSRNTIGHCPLYRHRNREGFWSVVLEGGSVRNATYQVLKTLPNTRKNICSASARSRLPRTMNLCSEPFTFLPVRSSPLPSTSPLTRITVGNLLFLFRVDSPSLYSAQARFTISKILLYYFPFIGKNCELVLSFKCEFDDWKIIGTSKVVYFYFDSRVV